MNTEKINQTMNEKIIKWTITDRQKMHQIDKQTKKLILTNKRERGDNMTDRQTERQSVKEAKQTTTINGETDRQKHRMGVKKKRTNKTKKASRVEK